MKIVLAIILLFPIAIFQIYIVVDVIKIARDNSLSKRKEVNRQSNYYKDKNLKKNNIRVISK